jgi:hypothetical protein
VRRGEGDRPLRQRELCDRHAAWLKANHSRKMPVTMRLAYDDGPIFSTVAELVEALKRSIPEGTQNAERKN